MLLLLASVFSLAFAQYCYDNPNEALCIASSNNCRWRTYPGMTMGHCEQRPQGCPGNDDSASCTTNPNNCQWRDMGNCMMDHNDPCQHHNNPNTCVGNCEWHGSCYRKPCSSITSSSGCHGRCHWDGNICKMQDCYATNMQSMANCTGGCIWHDSSYCTDFSCSNIQQSVACDAQGDKCHWNGYCNTGPRQCSGFTDQSGCTGAGYRCRWHSYSGGVSGGMCQDRPTGCVGHDTISTCSGDQDHNCAWRQKGHCNTKISQCHNYNTTESCPTADCEWMGGVCSMKTCSGKVQGDCNGACHWDGSYCMPTDCYSLKTSSQCIGNAYCQWDDHSFCQDFNCYNFYQQSECGQYPNECHWSGNSCLTGTAPPTIAPTLSPTPVPTGSPTQLPTIAPSPDCYNLNQTDCIAHRQHCRYYTYPGMSNGMCMMRPHGCPGHDTSTDCNADTQNNCYYQNSGNCHDNHFNCYGIHNASACNPTHCEWNPNTNYCKQIDCYSKSQSECTGKCEYNPNWGTCNQNYCSNHQNQGSCNAPYCTWHDTSSCQHFSCSVLSQTDCRNHSDCTWSQYNYCMYSRRDIETEL